MSPSTIAVLGSLAAAGSRRGWVGPTWPVLPGGVLAFASIVISTGAVLAHWSDVRGIQDRKEVLERALGPTWSRITTWMLWVGLALLFVGIAVMGALGHSG